MPIVAHSSLPTFGQLRSQGEQILTVDEASTQDIRALHIGLLNMMPDAALRVTEQQFIRLVGGANQIVQIFVYPFTVPGLPRSPETQRYIDDHYESLDQLQHEGLDALVVSGANVSNPELNAEPFWGPLGEVMGWAIENVTSIMCSCLATHALVQHFYGIRRRRLLNKRWGVYAHHATRPDHPLLRGTNTRFDVPHSRWNEITSAQMEQAGLGVLIESLEGDFHLGVSPDGIRTVYMQGHPEYDATSLLKEYKREVSRYLAGEITAIPPHPANYLPATAAHITHDYLEEAIADRDAGRPPKPFPDAQIAPLVDNTWTDTGKAVFNNWLGLVYRLTDVRRGVPFMRSVDPDDPLGLRGGVACFG
jgi:homoserine O-succinyltransferase/O-acetyltransferase